MSEYFVQNMKIKEKTHLKNYDKYSDLTPKVQPPTFGVGHKDNFIKFFWNNFVKHNIKSDLKIPHFILYSYVLFEISFESIDKNIFILSYEDEVSFFNTTTTFKMGTDNRMIMIPYVLNGKPINSFPTMTKILSCEKTRELTFIGSLYSDNSEDRPLINRVRNFILHLNSEVYIGNMSNIEQELKFKNTTTISTTKLIKIKLSRISQKYQIKTRRYLKTNRIMN